MVLETAVVGGGTVSETHLAGVQRLPEAALAAVCDPDEARARETARAYDVDAYADFEGMLAREDLDWIHLCTPVQTRLDLAEMALEDGVPVQIERPVTPTAREARELARLASAYETDVSVVHGRNFDPAVREAKALLDDGAIGAVRSVELSYTVDERDTRGGWASELRGGAVDAGLPDPIGLVLHFGGYPADTDAIQAAATRSQADERVTQYDGAAFQYASGAGVLCSGTVRADGGPRQSLTVTGDAGSLEVDLVSQTVTLLDRHYTSSWTGRVRKNVDHVLGRVGGTLKDARNAARRAVEGGGDDVNALGSHYGQFERDARAIQHGREMPVPIEEGIWTLEVIEAVRTAAATQGDGARIEIGSDAP